MKQFNLILIALLIISSFFIIQNTSFSSLREQKNVESARKKQWEFEMLRNPVTNSIPIGIRSREISFLKNMPQSSKKRGQEWRLRGPWNVGGRTRGLAIDVKNENHMIAGSVSGGIWQSQNGGGNWQKVSEPNAHPGVVSIAQDTRPGYENIWYALSGEITGTSAGGTRAFYLGDGAFRSLDNGNTWSPLGSTATGVPGNSISSVFQGGWRVRTSPINGDVYLAVYGAIYRSTDTGNTWTAVLGNGNNSYYTDVAISKTGVVYATLSADGGKYGYYRAADGVNFTDITPSYLSGYRRTVLTIDPNKENVVYFLSELDCNNCGGVISANYQGDEEYVSLQRYTYINGNGSPASNGGSWANLSGNLPLNSGHPFDDFNCQGGYDLCIGVQPGNSNNIIIGGTNLYRSKDGFQSPLNTKQIGGYGVATALPFFEVYPNHHPDLHGVIFSKSNPNVMYSNSDGGVHRTNNVLANDVSWQNMSLGYVTSQCYTVNIDMQTAGDTRMMVGLQDNGNYVSLTDHQQQEWRLPVNGDGAFGYISPKNNFYVTSIQLGRMVKMELDDRGNIVRRRRIDPDNKTKDDYSFINPLAVDPNNENYLYVPIGKKLFRLDNLSDIAINNDYSKLKSAWFEMPDSITTSDYTGSTTPTPAKISCLAISKKPSNIIYLGTNNLEIWRVENANTNNPIWNKTSRLKLPAGGNVNDIAIDPEDANKVLVAYSNYGVISLFYSENGGDDWERVGGSLETSTNSTGADPSIRSVAILKKADGSRLYFAGTSIGLFSTETFDGFSTQWNQESPDLIGANIVTDIKIRQSDGFIAVGTHGNGVFESYYNNNAGNPPTANVQVVSANIFPNPANNALNYSFGTGGDATIEIQMYNINGQYTMRKNLGLHTKGQFNYTEDVSHIPSGLYFLGVFNKETGQGAYRKIIIQH